MLSNQVKRHGTFGPDQLALLGKVIDRISLEQNWRHDDPRCADAALRLIELFESGLRTETALLEAMREQIAMLARTA